MGIEKVSGTSQSAARQPAELISTEEEKTKLGGTIKYETDWATDNTCQSFYTVSTPTYEYKGVKVFATNGEYHSLDTTPKNKKEMSELYVDKPLFPNFAAKLRVRTTEFQGDWSAQVRYGLQAQINLTDDDTFYALGYGANSIYEGGETNPSCGVILGLEHAFGDRMKGYLEWQETTDNHYINVGFKIPF